MKHWVAVLLLALVMMAGCNRTAGIAEDETATPAAEQTTPTTDEPHEPEQETPQGTDLESDPESDPEEPTTTGSVPPEQQPGPVVDADIIVSLSDPLNAAGQSVLEGTVLVLMLEFNGVQDVELPEDVEWPESYTQFQTSRVVGWDFRDGYCELSRSDTNGDSGKRFIMPDVTNTPLVPVPVRHDTPADTGRSVTVTLERCEFYLLEDLGITYAVSADDNTITVDIDTAGDLAGTVTTYSISMETTSTTVVEGETLPIQFRSDRPLPSCIEDDPDLDECPSFPLSIGYLATDSETGRSYFGYAAGTYGGTVFVPLTTIGRVPDTDFESTDRTMQVEMVELLPRPYHRLHSDGNYYWWLPQTEVYVAAGASTATVSVTDNP